MLGPIYVHGNISARRCFSERKSTSMHFYCIYMETTLMLPEVLPCFSSKDGEMQTNNDEGSDSEEEWMNAEDDVTSIPTWNAIFILNTTVSGTSCFTHLHVCNKATYLKCSTLVTVFKSSHLYIKLFSMFSCKQKV